MMKKRKHQTHNVKGIFCHFFSPLFPPLFLSTNPSKAGTNHIHAQFIRRSNNNSLTLHIIVSQSYKDKKALSYDLNNRLCNVPYLPPALHFRPWNIALWPRNKAEGKISELLAACYGDSCVSSPVIKAQFHSVPAHSTPQYTQLNPTQPNRGHYRAYGRLGRTSLQINQTENFIQWNAENNPTAWYKMMHLFSVIFYKRVVQAKEKTSQHTLITTSLQSDLLSFFCCDFQKKIKEKKKKFHVGLTARID